MTDKLYAILHEPIWIKARVKGKEAQINDLRNMMLPAAIRYDKDKVQTSASNDQMSNYASKIIKLEDDISRLKEKYLHAQERMMGLVILLKDVNEQNVIIQRYMYGVYFDKIALMMSASPSSVYRWHRKSIENLEKMIVNDS